LFDRLIPSLGLGNHLNIRTLQNGGNALANHRMIVGHQQIDCHQIPNDVEQVDRFVEHSIRLNVETIQVG
jgi:hypothetical protein